MQLSDDQKQAVRKWAAEGAGLSEIQKKLTSEYGLTMTFMDVRFLVIELGLELKEKGRAAEPVAAPGAKKGKEPAPAALDEDLEETPAPGISRVRVGVDRIMKPGSLVSGTVTFSDGVTGRWFLDQMGRLGLETDKAGYKPSRPDVEDFQEELRSVLEKQGF